MKSEVELKRPRKKKSDGISENPTKGYRFNLPVPQKG
jgi:hypothetical protein